MEQPGACTRAWTSTSGRRSRRPRWTESCSRTALELAWTVRVTDMEAPPRPRGLATSRADPRDHRGQGRVRAAAARVRRTRHRAAAAPQPLPTDRIWRPPRELAAGSHAARPPARSRPRPARSRCAWGTPPGLRRTWLEPCGPVRTSAGTRRHRVPLGGAVAPMRWNARNDYLLSTSRARSRDPGWPWTWAAPRPRTWPRTCRRSRAGRWPVSSRWTVPAPARFSPAPRTGAPGRPLPP
ncbi:hypothetical protein QJS66_17005 [Kocuria rhizophila]|nr:hypothetical protein QJS66_17005 [Kocuria rhizophila]